MENFFQLFFIPPIMIVFGVVLWIWTPKKNFWFGYRSKQSLKSEEMWNYANKTSGFYWFLCGTIFLTISNIIFFINLAIHLNILLIINFIIEVVVMLAVIPYTEIKLHNKIKNEVEILLHFLFK